MNKASVAVLDGYTSDFYSSLVEHMYDDLDSVRLLQMENLREELLLMLQQFDIPLSDATVGMIRAEKKRNTSDHHEFASYCDEATRMLVAGLDAAIIERFDYRFGT